ncbi:MAG: carbohydrate ABC transporter substrate-binding protein, partial [Acetivibrio ethanolgignens]
FVEWLFSSETGKDYVTNKLGFIAPFSTFGEGETPTDPLAQEVLKYMGDSGLTSVSWNFTAFPSQTFKDNLGYALLDYAQGTGNWDGVVSAFKDGWTSEKAATK